MFDFNCNIASQYGVYKNEAEFEVAEYMSSINISAGFHAGDPVSIKKALMFASEHNVAVGANVGYQDIAGFGLRKMDLNDEEIETTLIYQIGAIASFAKSFGLSIEHIKCHGALKDELNTNLEFAKKVASAIYKFDPWLNLYINNYEFKQILENEIKIKCAYEVNFADYGTIRGIREIENKVDTIHFEDVESAQKAYDVIKPSPINYNRVKEQV